MRIAGTSMAELASALRATGFGQEAGFAFSRFSEEFLPCPKGTFVNSSSRGNEGCIVCPPGIF